MASNFYIREVSFAEVEDEWRQNETNSNNSVFQTFDWNYYWARYFCPGSQVRLLAIFSVANCLLAIIPLRGKKLFGWPYSQLCADNVSDYSDIVVLSDKFYDLCKSAEISRSVSPFLFRNITQTSSLLGLFESKPSLTQFSQTIRAELCDSYLEAHCKKKQLKNAERLRKRLMELGDYEFTLQDQCPGLVREVLVQKQASLRRKGRASILFDERYLNFMEYLADHSHYWFVSTIRVNNEVIASSINASFGGVFYYYMPSFNEKFYKYSPSSVLIIELLRSCLSDGTSHFDFLKGDETYKENWAIGVPPTRLYLFSSFPAFAERMAVAARNTKLISWLSKH